MQGKLMVLAARGVRRSGGEAVVRWWPGGMRDGRILRFAEAETDLTSAVSDHSFNTAEPAGGAGRIQSLRAFRRARVIHARVRRCNGVTVQWLVWRESLF